MPHTNTFPPGTQVHIISIDNHEIAYWREDGKAFGCLRLLGHQSWEDAFALEIPTEWLDTVEDYFEQARQERNCMLAHCPTSNRLPSGLSPYIRGKR